VLALLPLALANWRILAIGAACAAVVAGGLYYRHELIVQGENEALQKVEDANAQSQATAAKAAKTVDDCFNAGGTWDRDAGVCNPAAR